MNNDCIFFLPFFSREMNNPDSSRLVAVIQAGTSGIGLAIGKRLARDGYIVVVSSRRAKNVDRALQEIRDDCETNIVYGVEGNASSDTDRKRLVAESCKIRADGKIHVLVCNAAASTAFGPLLETSAQQFNKMLDTNLMGTFLTIKQFSDRNAFAFNSSIIIVTSIGAYNPLPALGAYSVTKTALVALCKVLAQEMGASNKHIRVNCVAPGIIQTRFSERLWKPLESEQQGISDAAELRSHNLGIPLGRLGKPEDVSGVVSFLVSEDANYVNGEVFVVSGGMHSRL